MNAKSEATEASLASRIETEGEEQPVAWVFELANYRNQETGEYSYKDTKPQLSFTEPHVPEGAIRGLKALYDRSASPRPAVSEASLDDHWDAATNAVCQTMQERNMCNCPDGDCLAAKVRPEPADYAHFTAALSSVPRKGLVTVPSDVLEPFAALVERQDASDLAFLTKQGGDASDMSHYAPDAAKVHSSGEMHNALYLTKGDFRRLAKALRAASPSQSDPTSLEGGK